MSHHPAIHPPEPPFAVSLMILIVRIITPLFTLEPVRRADTVEDRLVPLFAHGRSDLERESQSVVEGSAVVVRAVVGEGGDVV
jgi:hypothetical protein